MSSGSHGLPSPKGAEVPTNRSNGGRRGSEEEGPTAAELDVLLALYGIERQNDQAVLNAQLVIVATIITYLTASVAVVVSDLFPPSPERQWAFALLPSVPTLLFGYLVVFLSDALYRRGYLNSIEAQIRAAGVTVPADSVVGKEGKGRRLLVPSWGEISKDVWAPPRSKRHWPLLVTQVCLFTGALALLLGLIAVVIWQLPSWWARIVVSVAYALPLVAVARAQYDMACKIGKEEPHHLVKMGPAVLR